ncbi:FG-GAP repeat protein [bacterium BMS3Bbin04]|nr:FG-GAP repeat protein [bacterium BMS3Bbin04]
MRQSGLRLENILLPILMILLLATSSQAGWYKHTLITGYRNLRSIYCADLDNDGDNDVVACARYDNMVGWWENEGENEWTEHILTTDLEGAWEVYADDVDGDGNIDILAAGMNAARIMLWLNHDGVWEEQIVIDNLRYAKGVYTGDFNGDGTLEILACSYLDDEISVAMNVEGEWIEYRVTTDFDGVRSVHADDVDQDGDMDILGASNVAGVKWWENGDGEWIEHDMPDFLHGARSVYTADFVGDSYREIMACSRYTDLVLYWEWDEGEEEWVGTIVEEDYVYATDDYAEDMDGDGDMDILACWFDEQQLSWYENVDRNGTWIEHDVSHRAYNALAVTASDIDGDGDNDILCGFSNPNQISWWENEPDDPLSIELIAGTDPFIYVIGVGGGDLEYSLNTNSILNAPLTAWVYEYLRLPNGEMIEVGERDTVDVAMGESNLEREVYIPGIYPDGDYKLVLRVCDSENNNLVADSLEFYKTDELSVNEIDHPLPLEFSISNVYPNPFNGTTGFSIHLPAPTKVRWMVTDILGRRVLNSPATTFSQGDHRINIDLEGHASGIYLLHVFASGQPSQSRKIVLMN